MTLGLSAPDDVAVPGCRIVRRGRVDSTNEEAKRLAVTGAPDRTFVWADEQRSGKGRHGRGWISPAGNLYVSGLLHPDCRPVEAAQVGFVAALALAEAIEAAVAGVAGRLTLKWPNDVLIDGSKVSGILLESQGDGGEGVDWLIVGIGVNVASHPVATYRPATSLSELGYTGSVAQLLEHVLRRMVVWLDLWQESGFAEVREAWLSRAAVGSAVTVRLGDEAVSGRFSGLDAHGALLLDGETGRRAITAGEVYSATG